MISEAHSLLQRYKISSKTDYSTTEKLLIELAEIIIQINQQSDRKGELFEENLKLLLSQFQDQGSHNGIIVTSLSLILVYLHENNLNRAKDLLKRISESSRIENQLSKPWLKSSKVIRALVS